MEVGEQNEIIGPVLKQSMMFRLMEPAVLKEDTIDRSSVAFTFLNQPHMAEMANKFIIVATPRHR